MPTCLRPCGTAPQEEGDAAAGTLLVGRFERLRPSGEAVVAVTGDDETCTMLPSTLLRPPTQEETVDDARSQAEADEARRAVSEPRDETPNAADAPPPPWPSPGGPAGAGPAQAGLAAAKPAAAEASLEEEDPDVAAVIAASLVEQNPGMQGGGKEATGGLEVEQVGEIRRVEYKPAHGWEESEIAARQALAARLEARRKAAPPQRETPGMDQVVKQSEAISFHELGGERVPVGRSATEGVSVVAAVKRTPGYDLVRVGNFTEKTDGSPADIAFFHNRCAPLPPQCP